MASSSMRRPPPCACRRSRCTSWPTRRRHGETSIVFCFPQPLGTVALIILLVFGRQPAAVMARVAALVGPAYIGDHRLLTLELHLERGHQGVFRVDDDVFRFSLLVETDGEPHLRLLVLIELVSRFRSSPAFAASS